MLLKQIDHQLSTRFLIGLCLTLAFCFSPMVVKAQNDDDEQTERERCRTQKDVRRCVKVFVTFIDQKTVADVFGRRIGGRFVAIQVTITNRSDDFQFLVHDVSLDLREIYVDGLPVRYRVEGNKVFDERGREVRMSKGEARQSDYQYELSSLELSLLRGVAEKGQGQDRRNMILRIFRGVGTFAAGLIGVASFGSSYAESVAVFNGPLISAYMDIFPDYTVNQLNRLNDTAYRSNTLIPKQQARVLVAFVPQTLFMNKRQRKLFRDDPTQLFAPGPENQGKYPRIDFRRAQAVIDGNFITEVENLPLATTSVVIDPAEMKKFQNDKPEVKGYISGRSLANSKIRFLNQEPEGLTIEEESTTDNRLFFKITSAKPVPPGTPLSIEVSKGDSVQVTATTVNYIPDLPTLTAINPAEGQQGESEIVVSLTGTNFIPNTALNPRATRVITEKDSKLSVVSVDVKNATSLDVTLRIDEEAPLRASDIKVVNLAGESNPLRFTVTAPPDEP